MSDEKVLSLLYLKLLIRFGISVGGLETSLSTRTQGEILEMTWLRTSLSGEWGGIYGK